MAAICSPCKLVSSAELCPRCKACSTSDSATAGLQAIYLRPEHAVRFLTRDAAVKLGGFTVRDTTVRRMLQGDTILCLGADSKDIDWHGLWNKLLDEDDSSDPSLDRACSCSVSCRPASNPARLAGQCAGYTAPMECTAWVVDIPGAACADDQGAQGLARALELRPGTCSLSRVLQASSTPCAHPCRVRAAGWSPHRR